MFSNTPRGAFASANLYSLIETAKSNNLEPAHFLMHLFERIPEADSDKKLEALLPWNLRDVVPLLKRE